MSILPASLGGFLLIICLFPLINGVTITTQQGKIKGVIKKTLNGREFQAFHGIPYAKPPVESLRFKDPVPFGKWDDERDGAKEASVCIQKYLYDNVARLQVVGDEDCLYLNVYTPSSKKPKRYPVMFFIHGGGFQCGSSSSGLYGPEYLLDKDVILVTINYRLGVLGFASTEDVTMSGNYGLKDQVEALKWVKENIAAYGGNPESITIFGQSAGGASVHYHMISPLSKGLFHRAIPMSGTAHCPWAYGPPGVNRQRTHKLANLVGCPTDSSQLLLECLRTVSAYTFADLLTEYAVWGIDPVIPFAPVIEPKEVKNAFLQTDPQTVTTNIPMMIGLTSDEGVFRTTLFLTSPYGVDKTLEVLNDNFNDVSKVSVTIYEDPTIDYNEVGNKIREFYFGDKTIDKNVLSQVSNMYTDAWFLQGVTSAVRKHKGSSNVYLFAQRGPHSTSFAQSNSTEYFGVNHGDDLTYLFPMPDALPTRKFLSTQEKKTQQEMVTLWTNFAIHGDPTPTNSKWKKVSSNKDINYMHIEDGKFEMRNNLLPERAKFWQNIQWKSEDAAKSIKKDEL